MADKIALTDMAIKAMKPAPKGKRTVRWDSVVPSLAIQVTETGAKSFVVRKRVAGTKNPKKHTLGTYPAVSLIDARKRAREVLGKFAEGVDPKRAERERREAEAVKEESNFKAVAAKFKKKQASKNSSAFETKRIIDLYLVPTFGKMLMGEIKRSHINNLLDALEDGEFIDKDGRKLGGPVMADHVHAQLRKMMNWYATTTDDFNSPIVPGMARTKPSERKRHRTLSDDEIRALWVALDSDPPKNKRAAPDLYAAFVRVLFLSAQRREDVAGMPRSELTSAAWVIPKERHKLGKRTGQPKTVPLPKTALAIIGTVPQLDDSDLIFTTTGDTPYSGFSHAKARLDRAMIAELRRVATMRKDTSTLNRLDEVTDLLKAASKGTKSVRIEARAKLKTAWWTLHDLRRTAKTLMSRLGVLPHISEHALGHIVPGVEGVYDCWEFLEERRDALEKLATLVSEIVKPVTKNARAR